MPHWRWWVLVGLVDLNLDLLESGVEGALVRLERRGEEARGGGGLERTVAHRRLTALWFQLTHALNVAVGLLLLEGLGKQVGNGQRGPQLTNLPRKPILFEHSLAVFSRYRLSNPLQVLEHTLSSVNFGLRLDLLR